MKALINFYLNEWYFAAPMTIMMFIAFALVIWRALLNQGANSNLDALLPDLQVNLRKKGPKAATQSARSHWPSCATAARWVPPCWTQVTSGFIWPGDWS